jgi:SAM-dependent methyltransferase/acyl carrier protein
MTGKFVDDELTRVDYWTRHMREPVRFAEVFETLHQNGSTTFVEIGPHPTLLALGRRNSLDPTLAWAPSMRRGADEPAQLATALAEVYAAGADVDWAAFADHGGVRPEVRRKVDLPTYPWQRSSYWSSAASSSDARSFDPARHDAPMFAGMVAAAELQAGQGPLDLEVSAYPQRWVLLDRLAGAAIARALRELGLFSIAGETRTVRELFDSGLFVAGYEHLAERWLGHLVDDGLLSRDGDHFACAAPLPDDITDLVAMARSGCAGVEPLLDYIERCIDHLAAVVNGRESALNTLFPDGSYETVDFLYGSWAVPRYFNAIVRAAVAAAAAGRPGRSLRVLEVGAGTGGTSASVLPALPVDRTSYTFTDVSDFFLTRAAERFAAYPFVRYAKLDIAEPPESQGYELGTYDLVIAANVLHATRDLDVTLGHVRSLLAPGGALVAYEGTEHPRWFDITTGLIEGWQLFEDEWRTDVPLIDVKRWCAALSAADFDDIVPFPADRAPTAALLSNVLMARASGDEVATTDRWSYLDHAGIATVPTHQQAASVVTDVCAALADAMPDERHDILVDAVRHAIAFVLRIADAAKLPRDQPLLDLGFDSLMAVELRNVLKRSLALEHKLPATLVFDHPTVAAIANYLELLLSDHPAAADLVVAHEARSAIVTAMPLVADALADLSEDEVEAMLLQRLTEIEG